MTSSRKFLIRLLKLTDLTVVALAFAAALAATGATPKAADWMQILEVRVKVDNLLFTIAYLGVWYIALRSRGLYASHRLSEGSREIREIGLVVLCTTTLLLPAKPLFRFVFVTPSFLLAFASLAFIGLAVERQILRTIGATVRRYGRNLRNVVVVGTGDSTLGLMSLLARREDLGYVVVQVIDVSDCAPKSNGNGKASGRHATETAQAVLSRLEDLVDREPIDEIFIALPLDAASPLIRSLMASAEEQGITVRLLAQVADLYWSRANVDTIEGQPVLTISSGTPDPIELLLKRFIDIVGATIGLIVMAPLFAVIMLAIKLDSPGRVFFAQERVGYNRRRFRALKFRTMVEGAETMQAALEPLNEAKGPVFKIRDDPRVTRVGKWLRRLSIDELPQLFNVLYGHMSLVGPRPLPVRDVDRIDVRWHKRRFSVKPGITCLWQVDSRQPEFDEWIKLDMEYIDNWSLILDLKILARTIPAVLSGQGAS